MKKALAIIGMFVAVASSAFMFGNTTSKERAEKVYLHANERDIVKSCVRESWAHPHSKINLRNFPLSPYLLSVLESNATDHFLNQLITAQSIPVLLSRCC